MNELVKSEYAKGHETILYGYSAGSLLSVQYMTNRLPVININEILKDNSAYTGASFDNIVKNHYFAPTCLDALKESKLVFYTDDNKFVANPDAEYINNTISKLNDYTKNYCAPEGAVRGFVVFGAPLTTFDTSVSLRGTPENTSC